MSNDDRHLSSTRNAFINFFKSLFGAGVLSLPHAFSTVGLPLSLIIFSLIFLTCLFSCYLLLQSKSLTPSLSNSPTTFLSLSSTILSPSIGRLIGLTICTLELLFCSGFIIAIKDNLNSSYPSLTSPTILTVLTPTLLILGQIKWLSDLCCISFLGITVYFIGVLVSSTIYSLRNWSPPPSMFAGNLSNVREFAGTAVYSLEGICLVLPVEGSMERKGEAFLIVGGSLSFYAVLIGGYAAIAYGGGLAGEGCDIVTDCIEGDNVKVLRLALSVALILSHPVTLFPASEILTEVLLGGEEGGEDEAKTPLINNQREGGGGEGEEACLDGFDEFTPPPKSLRSPLKSSLLRVFTVSVTLLLGFSGINFSTFSNIVGAIGLSTVGFVVPVFLYVKAFQKKHGSAKKIQTNIKIGLVWSLAVGFFNIFVVGGGAVMKLFV